MRLLKFYGCSFLGAQIQPLGRLMWFLFSSKKTPNKTSINIVYDNKCIKHQQTFCAKVMMKIWLTTEELLSHRCTPLLGYSPYQNGYLGLSPSFKHAQIDHRKITRSPFLGAAQLHGDLFLREFSLPFDSPFFRRHWSHLQMKKHEPIHNGLCLRTVWKMMQICLTCQHRNPLFTGGTLVILDWHIWFLGGGHAGHWERMDAKLAYLMYVHSSSKLYQIIQPLSENQLYCGSYLLIIFPLYPLKTFIPIISPCSLWKWRKIES